MLNLKQVGVWYTYYDVVFCGYHSYNFLFSFLKDVNSMMKGAY